MALLFIFNKVFFSLDLEIFNFYFLKIISASEKSHGWCVFVDCFLFCELLNVFLALKCQAILDCVLAGLKIIYEMLDASLVI